MCFKFYTCHKPSFIKCKFLKYITVVETLFGHVFVFTCLEPQRMKASRASLDHHPLSSWGTMGKAVPFPHCHFNLRKSKVHLPVSLQQLTYNGRGLQGLGMYSSAPFSLHFKHCFLPYSKAALLTCLPALGEWLVILSPLPLDNGVQPWLHIGIKAGGIQKTDA